MRYAYEHRTRASAATIRRALELSSVLFKLSPYDDKLALVDEHVRKEEIAYCRPGVEAQCLISSCQEKNGRSCIQDRWEVSPNGIHGLDSW